MITGLVALLVLLSFGMIVTVPVALATPGVWEQSQTKFYQALEAWISLVIIIAVADGVATINFN